MPGEPSRRNGRKGGRPKGTTGTHPKTARFLARQAGEARALQRLEITAERTMLEIGRVAFANRTAMWQGRRLLPFDEWPADLQALVEGSEVIIKNAAAGDGHQDTVHKVQLAKKMPALEALGRHFGLFEEKQGGGAVEERLLQWLDATKVRNRLRQTIDVAVVSVHNKDGYRDG